MIILWCFPLDFVNSLPAILSKSNFNPQRNTQQRKVIFAKIGESEKYKKYQYKLFFIQLFL